MSHGLVTQGTFGFPWSRLLASYIQFSYQLTSPSEDAQPVSRSAAVRSPQECRRRRPVGWAPSGRHEMHHLKMYLASLVLRL